MSENAATAAPLTDYEKVWMTIGKLTTSIEALEQLHASQAALINSLVAGRVQDTTNARALKQRVADLERSHKVMLGIVRNIEYDVDQERGKMAPAIAAVEALAELLPDKRHRCRDAESCEERR